MSGVDVEVLAKELEGVQSVVAGGVPSYDGDPLEFDWFVDLEDA